MTKKKNKGFYVVRKTIWDWYPTRLGAVMGSKKDGGVIYTAEQYERMNKNGK